MVLPMKGTQWKTTGGSVGFLKRSCRSTLITMAKNMKVATPAAMRKGVDVFASVSVRGPAISAIIPILIESEEEKVGERGGGRKLANDEFLVFTACKGLQARKSELRRRTLE